MFIYSMRFQSNKYGNALLALALVFNSCTSDMIDKEIPEGPDQDAVFPDFITPNSEYFDTRINGIPAIDGEAYELKISGAVNYPQTFSLDDLRSLEMVRRALTIECIGNAANGVLLGTAYWRGFRVYDLLEDLGIQEGARTVKYISADGYFTYNTLEELKNGGVLGALYMNDEAVPPLYGFPLRIIFPGYFGVRQPGWIVEMEVLESGAEDFWSGSGWKSDSSMAIDSKIFFPASETSFVLGDSIRIGGAAFGAKRISSVEVTLDDGSTWIPARIIRSLDQDDVWVFWEVYVTPVLTGPLILRSRAVSADGTVQPVTDNEPLDGINSWPAVSIQVVE